MPATDFILDSPSGARLHGISATPAQPRAVVHILHDLAEHSGRYAELADHLAERGIAAIAHDHRGHGKTRAEDAPRGTFATAPHGAASLQADIVAVQEKIVADHGLLPVILFGQGLGAAAALDFLFGHHPRIAGAALWGLPVPDVYSARFLGAALKWERFRRGSDVPSPTMRRLTLHSWSRAVRSPRTMFDWLSEDPAVVDAYVDDPDCGFEPGIGMWLDAVRLFSRATRPARLAALPSVFPLFVAVGQDDAVTGGTRDHRRLLRMLADSGHSNLKSATYRAMRHDLVNGLNRNITWGALAEWVDDVIGPTPSA